jgi:hypothetical protein
LVHVSGAIFVGTEPDGLVVGDDEVVVVVVVVGVAIATQ